MSLDLYINSKTPVIHRDTGVFIKENGSIRVLKTKQEVLTYFPECDPDTIKETSYQDNTLFHCNLTHNLTTMANKCSLSKSHLATSKGNPITLYKLLWGPEEHFKITTPTWNYMYDVMDCLKRLSEEPEFFKQYNPSNGWGSYEQLLQATKDFTMALHESADDFENYEIYAST